MNDFNDVLKWVRANVFIVVFVVLMLAAVVGLPFFVAKGMAESGAEARQARAAKYQELDRLRQTTVTDPVTGETAQGVVNARLLEDYRRIVELQREDAAAVREQAVAHNRDDHQPIEPDGWDRAVDGPWVLPQIENPLDRQTRPRLFHEELVEAYGELLDAVNAGMPPAPDTLEDALLRAEAQFRSSKLAKSMDDELTEEEAARLEEELGRTRLSLYSEAAARIGVYLDRAVLDIPDWNIQNQPDMNDLFEWQWRYWIVSDLLGAIDRANADAQSVLRAPVKRIVNLEFLGAPADQTVADPNAGNTRRGARGRRGSSRGSAGPTRRGGPDYSATFTGRSSNEQYDVRLVGLSVIIETDELETLFNALARQNFITVLDLTLVPVDPFVEARRGFVYRSDRLSRVDLVLETIWLREWTTEFMPEATKERLGIRTPGDRNRG